MPFFSRIVAGIALLVMSTGCQRQTAELTQVDKDAVRAEIEKYRQAALAADWTAWGNTLAADVFLSPANVAPMTGRDAAVAWVKTFPKVTGLTLNIEEITGRDDLAFARDVYARASLPEWLIEY
jgi:ketosteroid isomerase-like protein